MPKRTQDRIEWARTPKLEIRFDLQNDCIGTREDDRMTNRLQEALTAAFTARGFAVESHAISGGGKTSLFFEGDAPGALYDLARPLLGELLPRRHLAVLHEGELLRRWLDELAAEPGVDLEPHVDGPASLIVSLRLQDDDSGTPADDALIAPIVEDIAAAFEHRRDVWWDGDEYGGGWYRLFFYGDDDDEIFAAVEPYLARFGDREIVCDRSPVRIGYKPVFRDVGEPEWQA